LVRPLEAEKKLAAVARAAASGCSIVSTQAIRCATLATMWHCAARGGMGQPLEL